jgi:hypothetical protein
VDKPAVLVCDPKPFETSGAVVLLPDAAVIKAGLSGTVLRRSLAARIDAHELCGIAPRAPIPFPGRILWLRFEAPYKPKDLAARLRTAGVRRAQILPKGVRRDEAEILKDLGLAHGDQAWVVVALMPSE